MLFRGGFSTFGFCPRTHRQRYYFHSVDAGKMQLFTFQPERSILGRNKRNEVNLPLARPKYPIKTTATVRDLILKLIFW